jgi:hypothetical protein
LQLPPLHHLAQAVCILLRLSLQHVLEPPSAFMLPSHTMACCWFRCAGGNNGSSQFEFRELNMNKTLQENDVLDEASTFESLDLPTDFHTPMLHVYWNDDLTVA